MRQEARGKRGEIERHTASGRKKIVGRRRERERDIRGRRESCREEIRQRSLNPQNTKERMESTEKRTKCIYS